MAFDIEVMECLDQWFENFLSIPTMVPISLNDLFICATDELILFPILVKSFSFS